jgi:hypothetical protein
MGFFSFRLVVSDADKPCGVFDNTQKQNAEGFLRFVPLETFGAASISKIEMEELCLKYHKKQEIAWKTSSAGAGWLISFTISSTGK